MIEGVVMDDTQLFQDDELFGDSFESSLESPRGNHRIYGENGPIPLGMQGAMSSSETSATTLLFGVRQRDHERRGWG